MHAVSRSQTAILPFAVSTLIRHEYKKPGLEEIKEIELFIWNRRLRKMCFVLSVYAGSGSWSLEQVFPSSKYKM
uniref:Uncharacterized protein n=1 Tax=Arundo donax TaxID=35708 RepID=A0A0A9DBQ3_ARUDO